MAAEWDFTTTAEAALGLSSVKANSLLWKWETHAEVQWAGVGAAAWGATSLPTAQAPSEPTSISKRAHKLFLQKQ